MAVHPVIQRHIKIWYRQKMHLASQEPIESARKKLIPLLPFPDDLYLDYRDHIVDGDFVIRLFYPEHIKSSPSPLIIFLRASGFSMGSIENYNLPCAHLAKKSGCIVAGVAHRLSPEHKYPIPLDDCEKAVMWLHQQAKRFNLCPNRFALWGECSGANISTSLCHRLRDKKINLFVKHIMLYPPLVNHRMTPSKQKLSEGYITDLDMINFTLDQYCTHHKERGLKEVSPILQEQFEGLPPTILSVGEYDPLKDDGELYAKKFLQHNPNITFKVHPGLVHGFIQYFDAIDDVNLIIDDHVGEILKAFQLS